MLTCEILDAYGWVLAALALVVATPEPPPRPPIPPAPIVPPWTDLEAHGPHQWGPWIDEPIGLRTRSCQVAPCWKVESEGGAP